MPLLTIKGEAMKLILEELEKAMTVATKNLQKCETTNSGGARYEKEYGTAFNELVKAGLRLSIRKKYRVK